MFFLEKRAIFLIFHCKYKRQARPSNFKVYWVYILKLSSGSKSMLQGKPFVVSLGNLTVFLPAGRLRANGKPSSAYFLDYYLKLKEYRWSGADII
ncbi:hypothetical protein B0182_07485 [Moraxella bovis]|nr:hypothetical protein DQF64_04950 [Moraxella bovis]OOR89214.1 hypothetical protein B0182_07485 [Moraxella bovis]